MDSMEKHALLGSRIFVVRNFLTPAECAAFIARSENSGYEEATITTNAGFVMNKEIRDNARLILDDPLLADTLWHRARPFIPPTVDEWRVIGFNERFRFYRYDVGQKFARHYDGYFERKNGERSQLTFMVYLNADFQGGETQFFDENFQPQTTVRPEAGMALAFVHLQLHEGVHVVEGRKYVLRTDVMYASSADAR